MELYLLKSVACLAICFVFYKIFLERANMHTFKRFYLLGALIAAILIPFITFTSYVEVPPKEVLALGSEGMIYTVMEVEKAPNILSIVLTCIYGLGVLFFGLKFGRNLFRMIQKIRKNPHLRDQNIFHVLLNSPVTPHTFFSYIFLNRRKFEAREIPKEVLIHERAHAIEKHSLDILFVELLQIVFWFNPLLYVFKNSIKLNHEFLADRAVIEQGSETSQYQNILLAFSSNAETPQLANSINYSSPRLNKLFSKNAFGQVKKRFTVMKTHTSKRGVLLRSLLLLPLLAILIYGFSTTQIVEKEKTISEVNKREATPQEVKKYNQLAAHWNEQFSKAGSKRIIELADLKVLETLYRKMSTSQKSKAEPFPDYAPPPPPPIPADATEKQKQKYQAVIDGYDRQYNKKDPAKATPKQIAEYNKLARKYNTMDPNNMVIKKKEIARLKYLYDLMTKEQRKDAEPFPNIPPPPPPPDAPDAPDAPEVIKGGNDGDPNVPPPPPPPPPAPKTVIKLNTQTKFVDSVKVNPVIKTKYNIQVKPDSNIPPPPPPPDTKEHLKKMNDLGATFYYEDKEVTYNYVIDLVLFNKNLNIQTKTSDANPPVVYISKSFVYKVGNK